jgi:hypothetical protein
MSSITQPQWLHVTTQSLPIRYHTTSWHMYAFHCAQAQRDKPLSKLWWVQPPWSLHTFLATVTLKEHFSCVYRLTWKGYTVYLACGFLVNADHRALYPRPKGMQSHVTLFQCCGTFIRVTSSGVDYVTYTLMKPIVSWQRRFTFISSPDCMLSRSTAWWRLT